MATQMPTYVYCLVSASHEPPADAPRGLDGARVRVVRAGRLAAWTSDVADRRLAASVERVRAHDAIVRCALDRCGLEGGTPLPARFGQTFATDADVAGQIREREDAWLGALERVRGMVEMTVRVRLAIDAGDAAPVIRAEGASGREYLERLRERQRAERMRRDAVDVVRRRVGDAVGSAARAESVATIATPHRWLSISHLVARDAVPRYRAALDALAAADPMLRLAVSGPWAPYSFAEVTRV